MSISASIPDTSAPPDRIGVVLRWTLFILAIALSAALVLTTIRTERHQPPLPERFVSPSGQVLISRADLLAGKAGFQRADLMDYGSLYGMGSYFGEDYTAEYLVALARGTEANLARARYGKPLGALDAGQAYMVREEMRRDLHGIALRSKVVVLPAAVAEAVTALRPQIVHTLLTTNLKTGWTRAYSLTPESAAATADFLIYSSLTTVARRPGTTVSYTSNWPYEPLVGNAPTTATFAWTWASYLFAFLMFGVVLYLWYRFIDTPDEAPKTVLFDRFRALTPSQRAVGKYFLLVAAVLLLQIGAGGLMAHYYSDRGSFYGLVLNRWLPFNALRDIHIQAPIVWIGVAWIGAALFLAPLIAGTEARGQGVLVSLLFWTVVAIVVGALLGDYLGIMGLVGRDSWFWVGNQGLSYLQLGRAWQIGFAAGLVLWSAMVLRALWPTRAGFGQAARAFATGRISLEHLFWAASLNIAVLYWFGMIPMSNINPSFTMTDYWRWWVVHLWVEQSFEFFAAVVSAYLLVAVGLVSRRLAERAVLFEVILVFLGGMLGTGHHWYWAGEPGMWVPVGSMFSFIEVLPLLLLVIEAVQQRRLIRAQRDFKYGLAYTYIIGAAVWNFVGAGVFGGGTLNAPLVNYYEHATTLTLNHAHTALFGAFGLLAIGMVYFCLRYAAGDRVAWSNRLGLAAFWLYNLGMVMWIVLTFFPVGWLQLNAVYEHGLAYARSLAFYNTVLFWQWLRMPGDIVFALAAFLMGWDFLLKLRPFYPRLFAGAGKASLPAEAKAHGAD
ncbi:MAG: cbb3-type cytochrome c oxidase subunit I [Rhodospirillales bacterium]|nr:cbb3-type cytochrome c oxidase subunit I [Rhodospirillales bacterium]